MKGRFLRLMAVGDEATEEMDEAGAGAAVAGVFDLGDVFEVLEDGFDTRTFTPQELVRPQEEARFHFAFERRQYVAPQRRQQLLGQRGRDRARVGK